MMHTIPDVVADPVGVVVDLVAAVEPAVDRPVIEALVRAAAGGRAKQRKLASALADRPQILVDGRSPAPRAVGDLLIALRAAGAVAISPPVCAQCDKHLRSLQRRGEDWYCGACGPARESCASCGTIGLIHARDRVGRPRCAKCPPDDVDPVELIVDVIAGIEPDLPAQAVIDAVTAAIPAAGRRHAMAWAVSDRPELLTGAGAQAPVPAVLRLIDGLVDAGATRIVKPPCPGCGRVIPLVKPRNGVRLCRNCVAKSRAEQCSRCPAVREPATRDADGKPVCPHCLITDPVNQEICTGCARRRPVAVRGPDGPLCPNCRPVPTMTCSICGRQAPCVISKTTGQPWCQACKQRWARCHRCHQVRPIRGGTATEPLCSTCTRDDPEFWHNCPGCGQPGRLHAGQCARCNADRRLREFFSGTDGHIRPHLQPLYQALAKADRPATVMAWFDKGGAPAILRALELKAANAPLTHNALDSLPPGKTVEHLRAVLVAVGMLPPRDEQMVRLERWISDTISGRADGEEQQILRHYALWHLLRRLRRRTDGTNITHTQYVIVRQHVRGAITVLNWLAASGLSLANARQPDLETWLVDEQPAHRREIGHFLRWAKQNKMASLEFAATRWDGPTRTIDTDDRWEQARRLLHDDTVKSEDRVAGLLVLLYAQWPAAISRLRVDQVQTDGHEVRLKLGAEPVALPEPLAGLVLHLVASRQGHAAVGDDGTSGWLFPGGQPGRPISAFRLGERLREIGIHPGQARSTALFGLATELPAALLARMLGIHISVAVAWQRASSGDWTSYAAEVSRRDRTQTTP